MTLGTVLLLVAFVFVLVDIVKAQGRNSLTTYAVLLVTIALLFPFVIR